MHSTPHASRELLDRHLTLIAESEERGFPEVGQLANEIWSLHEVALDALNEILAQVTE
jgi:hypothetical protein